MAEYEVYLTDDSGRRITILNNFAFLSISRTTLGYGTLHIGIPFRDFNVFPAFLPDRRIETWRSPAHGATMRREGSFLLRKYNVYTREEDNLEMIEFYGRSPIDILRRQHVVSTTAANYSKTNEVDDMMKEIVTENFITPQQTAPSGELSVDGTQALGPSISHTFFGQNVLDILKELRDISFSLNESAVINRRIYFDVVEGSPLANGGFGYIFRTYADLRGIDRTDGTIFSVENGNMKSASYYEDYLDSFTIASILNFSNPATNGSAESPDRYISRWGDIVRAQQSSEASADLNDSKANDLLQDGKSDRAFNATFLDSPGSNQQPRSLYGVDWDLGDLLPVRYARKDFITEVVTVYISVNEKGEENIVGISSPRIILPTQTGSDAFTVVLLHFNGTDASTLITDQQGSVWVADGNAQIDTAQSVFGGASLLLDGTGDWVETPDSNVWRLDDGSNSSLWTIDFRVRFNGDPGTGTQGFITQHQDVNNMWAILIANNLLYFYVRDAGVDTVTVNNAWNPATATWYHVAIVKNGTSGYMMFIDGVQIGVTQTDTSVIPNIASPLYVGVYTSSAGATTPLAGWLDEFRISKGVARWTGNFTPPTAEY